MEVRVARAARADLRALVASHSLPGDTRDRVRSSLRLLERFPLIGPSLGGRWEGTRFLVGPWRWMIILYVVDVDRGVVTVVALHDVRSSNAATSQTEPPPRRGT